MIRPIEVVLRGIIDALLPEDPNVHHAVRMSALIAVVEKDRREVYNTGLDDGKELAGAAQSQP